MRLKALRDVAQLVARLLWEQDVAGSNPVIPTKQNHGVTCHSVGFVPSERSARSSIQGRGKRNAHRTQHRPCRDAAKRLLVQVFKSALAVRLSPVIPTHAHTTHTWKHSSAG